MSRLVKVVSTTSGTSVHEVQSAATTWIELKNDLNSAGISTEGLGATVRETRNTLERDDAVLPEGDFHLYLSPTKVKSGVENYGEMTVGQLQDLCNELGLPNSGTTVEMVGKINAFYQGVASAKDSGTVTREIKDLLDTVREFANQLTSKIDDVEGLSEEDAETINDFKEFVNSNPSSSF